MRDTKNGQSKIVTFSMTDHKGSVNCKLFLGGNRQREDGSVEQQAEKLRAALKDESDPAGERLDAVSKLNEIFSYPSVYPVFESREDAANVKFDANVNAQYTPFHNVRAGLWNANMICERLMDELSLIHI